MPSTSPKILVIGSLNVDHTFGVKRIPKAGETLTAHAALTCFGGKGANQALAAARAGGAVTLKGCVGEDDFGNSYAEHLTHEGINTRMLERSPEPTGSAFIAVDEQGENIIIVHPGANHALLPEHLNSQLFQDVAAVLLQLECPLPTVLRAIELANEAAVPVILNPSPLSDEFVSLRLKVDTLIVNEHEDSATRHIQARVRIVTHGSQPTVAKLADEEISAPPPKVTPIDTVGAGDSFAGAYAVAMSEGRTLDQCLRFANAAGALATLKPGAQPSIPTRSEIMAFLAD